MTTTVKVCADTPGAIVTTTLHNADGDRETTQELGDGEEASFVIHNTLSLRIVGTAAEVVVEASQWPVRVIENGEEGDPIPPRGVETIVIGDSLELTERPAPEPAAD